MSECEKDVLNALKEESMTVVDLYTFLPSYDSGECKIDEAIVNLQKQGLVCSDGKKETSWGKIILWKVR